MTATTTRESRWATAGGSATNRPGGGAGAPSRRTGEAEPEPPQAKPPLLRSKKFLLVIVAALGLGFGAYKFLAPTPTTAPRGGDVVAMDPTTLNLADGHYLKIAVAVQLVKGKATATDFSTSHAAELVIDQFSNRTVQSLSSNSARKQLTGELLGKLQKAYPERVYDVFLTQFVMQ